MPQTAGNPGLILFAHGARDARWTTPFEAVAARVRAAQPAALVRLAYLEFIAPSLLDAGTELADAGCHSVTVLPMFLGAGGHVRKDLPLLMQQLQAAHPQMRFVLHGAIGEQADVIDAMAAVAATALAAATAATA